MSPALPKGWANGFIRDGGDHLVFDHGLGLKPLKMHLGRRVKGYICSTNFNHAEHKKKILQVTCDTKMETNNDFEGDLFTRFNIQCPANCKKTSKGQLIGNFIYKDDSSLCLAAVHAGAINDQSGGICTVSTEAGLSSYAGGGANGVVGVPFTSETPSPRSFVVDKFIVQCP